MAIQVGDHVRVLPPFDKHWPGVYTVDSINPASGAFRVCGENDFDAKFLEVTLDAVTHPTPPPPPPTEAQLAARVAALETLLVQKAVATPQEVIDAAAVKEASGKLAIDEVTKVVVEAVAEVKPV